MHTFMHHVAIVYLPSTVTVGDKALESSDAASE